MTLRESIRHRRYAEAACCGAWPVIEDPIEFVRECVFDLAAELRVGTRMQCRWLACLLGDPLRPATIPEAMRTATIVSLSRAVYDENDWDRDRLVILAYALEEAACTDAELLDHLRGPGPHVRGCWVVDLIL
ncbi:hypothetical protein AYO40_01650 [Planctomycetaceae bacterium SCGC AG-212-D15]|nr:hypothetical protein AYO40_01650 [Planctomycetaceae bacterium SCGC AG-212-D15]